MEYGPGADEAAAARLAEFVASTHPVVLTGAGISTASGIPDYRGPDGQRRVQPMTYAEFRGSTQARQRYWARSFVGWRRLGAAAPNAAHRTIGRWQRADLIGTVITQNVDGLHQRGGALDVIDLHGSLSRVVCLACGGREARAQLDRRMALANPAFTVADEQIRPDGDTALSELDVSSFRQPHCLHCGSDELKPDVVFFGESVPRPRVKACSELVATARGLVVIGSSLAVMSGLRLVKLAAASGIPIAIVTRGATRGDSYAQLRFDVELVHTLARADGQLSAR